MEIYNELSGCRLLMMHWRCEKTPCMQVVINIIVLYIYIYIIFSPISAMSLYIQNFIVIINVLRTKNYGIRAMVKSWPNLDINMTL